MKSNFESEARTAVVGDRAAADGVTLASAAAETAAAHWARRDIDHVDRAVRAGRFDRVVFLHPEDFLLSLWNAELDWRAWRALGVQVEGIAANGLSLATIADEWCRWSKGQRRRRVIAAAVLSLAALVSAFLLIRYLPG